MTFDSVCKIEAKLNHVNVQFLDERLPSPIGMFNEYWANVGEAIYSQLWRICFIESDEEWANL